MLIYKISNWRAYFLRAFQKFLCKINGSFGVISLRSELTAKVIHADGSFDDLGLLSCQVITDAGVAFLVDDWDANTQDLTTMTYHDSGTGTNAENVTDVDLQTPAGPTTRATGTKSQPTAPQLRTVATITYSGTLAITEHGIFNQAARGAGTVLWDRSVFSAINVVSGDGIQFTYTCTVNSGG